jgi:glyoxylase-like metal-dependent hydrolase (beta-lactamase superfamily II)
MSLTNTLFEGVHTIEGEIGGRLLRLTLLVGEEASVLLDTGCAADVDGLILPALSEVGLAAGDLSWIVISHCDLDHVGGNRGMKAAAPQAILGCGDADLDQVESPDALLSRRYDAYRERHGVFYDEAVTEWMAAAAGQPQPVEVTFRGGERLRLSPDWQVELIHTPGHSRGHLAILDPKNRALYGADAIHGTSIPDLAGKAVMSPTYLYVEPYLDTIRLIENLGLDLLTTCHWPIARGEEIATFCAESRSLVEQADRLLLEAIEGSGGDGVSMRELCEQVGPALGDWPEAANIDCCYIFSGHLARMESFGIIAQANPGSAPCRYKTV